MDCPTAARCYISALGTSFKHEWRSTWFPIQILGVRRIKQTARSIQSNSTGSSGSAANAVHHPQPKPIAPRAISCTKYISGPNMPLPALGTCFHCYSSGPLLDLSHRQGLFVRQNATFQRLSWVLKSGRSWLRGLRSLIRRIVVTTVNEDGTKAWLLGCVPWNIRRMVLQTLRSTSATSSPPPLPNETTTTALHRRFKTRQG